MSKENTLKSVDTPSYSYWSALYLSFYSQHLYVDVGKRWRGIAFFYLLLAIAICSIPFVIRMNLSFNDAFKEQLIKPLEEIPVFYIQDGHVVFDKPMPYLVKDNRGQVVAIVDTTGKINDFSKYPSLTILVNKDKISLKEVLNILEESKETITLNKKLTEQSEELQKLSDDLRNANENLIIKIEDIDNFEAQIAQLLENRAIDAILAVNELFAVTAIKLARKMGLDVPHDLSVIAFTDGIISQYSTPTITTVSQNGIKMGQKAAKMLIDRIELDEDEEHEELYRTEVIETDLIQRESTQD
mgnify:CR=1 FL=1